MCFFGIEWMQDQVGQKILSTAPFLGAYLGDRQEMVSWDSLSPITRSSMVYHVSASSIMTKTFLNRTHNVLTIREIFNKFDYVKVKNFYAWYYLHINNQQKSTSCQLSVNKTLMIFSYRSIIKFTSITCHFVLLILFVHVCLLSLSHLRLLSLT